MKPPEHTATPGNDIADPVARPDAAAKCAGTARYLADLAVPGMLHARTVRSTRPRARITSRRLPPLPAGFFVVEARDIPGRNRIRMLDDDWPFFAEDIVNHIGEPILLVVGPEAEATAMIASRVIIEYEDLPPILSLDDALAGLAPPLYGEDNCFAEYSFHKGDLPQARRAARQMVKDGFSTGFQEHLYLEPQGVLAVPEAGRLTVYGSMQCPYYVKKAVEQAVGEGRHHVRIVQTVTGGAFGGKEDYPSLLAGQAAVAALKSGRPVRLVLDRTEDIAATTKRHPSRIDFTTFLDENDDLLGMDVDILLDGGAYSGLSSVVLQRAMFAASGVYRVPHLHVHGRVLATNQVPAGAFRGFGAPQAFFAIEMHLENIALRLGLDPLEYKLRHALRRGDRTCTDGLVRGAVRLPEMATRLCEAAGYPAKQAAYTAGQGRYRRGIGLSLCYHGCGFTGQGEELIQGTIALHKRADDAVEIRVAATEMGQGAQTVLPKIVAHSLGIPLDQIHYENPDTDIVPDSGPTVASRTTMIVGGLLREAALDLKRHWQSGRVMDIRRTYHHPPHIHWDQEHFRGDAYPEYAWGVNVVEVEVDLLTGLVRVIKIWAQFDVGAPMDERTLRGQMEGGIAQGLGYALWEKLEVDDGRVQQQRIRDYTIPTFMDMPPVESGSVYNPYEFGPFGAKGAGELTLVGVAPAVAAAVQQAIGCPVDMIPVTPEMILRRIRNRKHAKPDSEIPPESSPRSRSRADT
ncbi:MAG: xanthine dehydrogenase family protein [Acidobacteria bacterium]|nr:xanthine dehydrogenase family protein [Acidobacteriota bacterium]